MFIFFMMLSPIVARNKKISVILLKVILIPVIIIQAIMDLIVYLYLIRSPLINFLLPLDISSLPSGWLKPDELPVIFMAVWMIIGYGVLIPIISTIIFSLNGKSKNGKTQKFIVSKESPMILAVGFGIFSVIMAFRWGSSWGLPFVQFVWLLIYLPIILYFIPSSAKLKDIFTRDTDANYGRTMPTSSLVFLGASFVVSVEFNSSSSVSSSILWLALSIGSAFIILITVLHTKKVQSESKGDNISRMEGLGKIYDTLWSLKFAIITWILSIALQMIIISEGINAYLVTSSDLWTIFALSLVPLLPFAIYTISRTKPRLALPLFLRMFFWTLSFFIGAAIPYLSMISHPITIYLVYVLDAVSILIMFLYTITNWKNGKDGR